MAKKPILSMLTVIVSVTLLLASNCFGDAERIFRENSGSVVVVIALDGQGKALRQGSGFAVGGDGEIATNFHVITDAEALVIKSGNTVYGVEGLLNIDRENDLVIIKSRASGLRPVSLGDSEEVKVGETVYVISSPSGLENTISDGILSGIRAVGQGRKVLQITAPVSGGSSGGPVMNKRGEVIGVATFIVEGAQNLNFAAPVNLLKGGLSASMASRAIIPLKDAHIKDFTKTAEYWFFLGYVYFGLGKEEEAVAACQEAIRINPDYAEAHSSLGATYHELGMYREAIESCRQAVKIDPELAEAHFNLGKAYIKVNDRASALKEYEILKSLDPKKAEELFRLIE